MHDRDAPIGGGAQTADANDSSSSHRERISTQTGTIYQNNRIASVSRESHKFFQLRMLSPAPQEAAARPLSVQAADTASHKL